MTAVNRLTLTIHGARGSSPVSGRQWDRYGGSTISIAVPVDDGRFLVIDGGTGLARFGQTVPEPGPDGIDFSFFFTHYHLDHLQGLPFFDPLYDERNRVTFYGWDWRDMGVEMLMSGPYQPPWFPIHVDETEIKKSYVELDETSEVEVGAVTVTVARLNHPQGVTAYRLQHGDRAVVLATDHESIGDERDEALISLATDADVLIHDAQYTEDEYERLYQGWGHSTWQRAVATAEAAGVERLILISHDPRRTDEAVDRLVAEARDVFSDTEAAYEGMTVSL